MTPPDIEYEILEKLAGTTEGIGSGTLYLYLRDRNLRTSPASVGRILRLLDYRDLTSRVSNKGRVLTPAGRRHLKELRYREGLRQWADSALRETKPTTQTEYLLALEALCCVELRMASLAAENASPAQMEKMHHALDEQKCRLRSGSRGKAQGLEFHDLVAQAADNRYIKSACAMIWSWNKTIHDLWTEADLITGKSSYPDHVRILAAIERRDPQAAAREMRKHFTRFISGLRERFQEIAPRRGGRRRDRVAAGRGRRSSSARRAGFGTH